MKEYRWSELRKQRWFQITTCVLGIVLGAIFMVVVGPALDKAQGATVDRGIGLVHDPGPLYGIRMAKAFRNDRLGHSTHRRIPRKMREHLNRYATRQLLRHGRYVRTWWRDNIVSRAECLLNTQAIPLLADATRQLCLKYGANPTVFRINKEITYIKVVCGGDGVLAFAGGAIGGLKGAFVGLGTGGGSCIWNRYSDWVIRHVQGNRLAPTRRMA